MSKIAAFMVLSLLLVAPLAGAARPEPFSPRETQRQLVRFRLQDPSFPPPSHSSPLFPIWGSEVASEKDTGCGGENEDECLMRRTLIAHVDYIYTQKKKDRR